MDIGLLLALLGVTGFVAVATGSLALRAFNRFDAGQTRFRAVTVAAPFVNRQSLDEAPDPLLRRLSEALPRSPEDMSQLRRRLARAGYDDLRAAVAYSTAEMAVPLLLASLVLFAFGVSAGWLAAVAAAAVGYVIPGRWLEHQTNQRKKAIQSGLPDVLDLLVVCMQAGSSLEQAMVKAGEELQLSHPALARELRRVTTEVRAGQPRREAFKNFERRTGVDDVRTLVALLVQTDRFGTSVSQALRTHAATSRTRRRQLAEERAGKVGVKLVFPLVFCSFPAVYLVCIGPVVVQIYRAFL